MKKIKIATILFLITSAILFLIYGSQKICNGEPANNGYCETKRTIYTTGNCPIGYTFYATNHTCKKIITSSYPNFSIYTDSKDYTCPTGYYKNNNIYHAHMPGYYQCCYKNLYDNIKAKSRFYYWFN